ncbi:hypothetical protein VZT92_005781 [Zoarces viviparus]|uniref:Uncharacterized protein n=2 Tax=Zoarces viviparus TaxID=48416 RepID=A0AAW1FMZ2_ZOAVI
MILQSLANKVTRLRRMLIAPGPPPIPVHVVKDALDDAVRARVYREAAVTVDPFTSVTEVNCLEEAVASAASLLARKLSRTGSLVAVRRRMRRNYPVNKGSSSSRRRRLLRRQLYCLWRKDRAKLALLVLDGQAGSKCPIPLPKITPVFKGRWGDVKPFGGLGQFEGVIDVNNAWFCSLITPLEVKTHIAAMKSRTAS